MRYLEIAADGFAFFETDFGGNVPPKEVFYCDCAGVGYHTYNPEMPKTHLTMGMIEQTPAEDVDDWKRQHSGPDCKIRRQIFVDVTQRLQARLGMMYDEVTDTFSPKV